MAKKQGKQIEEDTDPELVCSICLLLLLLFVNVSVVFIHVRIIRKVIFSSQQQQLLRNTMSKLFADYDLKRQKMEDVETQDRWVWSHWPPWDSGCGHISHHGIVGVVRSATMG